MCVFSSKLSECLPGLFRRSKMGVLFRPMPDSSLHNITQFPATSLKKDCVTSAFM